jgi:polysaccharide deacetylase 2 family uncharacterized protein YibQ
MHPAGRALIGFWAAILLLAGGGAIVLQRLGPPRPAAEPKAPAPPVVAKAPVPAVAVSTPTGGVAIPPPDPALLEPAQDFPDRSLPKKGAGGLDAAHYYAGRAGLPAHGPQVAVLLEQIGLLDELSHQAVDDLPAAISLGVSPYDDAFKRPGPDPLIEQARQVGHETWLCLPMEPAGSPLDNEGGRALSLSIDFAIDHKALEWSLSRFQGYVGVTNAQAGLRGDKFATSSAFAMVATELTARGLLYLDAGLAPHDTPSMDPVATRHADLTIDEQPDAPDIEARLSRLEQIARAQGSALGVAGPLRPVTIERLRVWSRGLAERGITLVPVSALPPPHPPAPEPHVPPPASPP